MKYRELSKNEIEAYNIGYKVGNRKIIITDIEWESENEHKIYRKGYMAGLMDFKRNVSNISNVNNVSNVDIKTPTTPIGISISNKDKDKEEKEIGGVGEKEKTTIDPEQKKKRIEQFEAMIQQLGKITTRKPNETVITYNEVRMPETLKEFIQQKFRPDTRKRAYDWMIDHVAGQQWNEDRIIKLLCKFESADVPQTRAEYIQFVSKTNRAIGCMAQKTA